MSSATRWARSTLAGAQLCERSARGLRSRAHQLVSIGSAPLALSSSACFLPVEWLNFSSSWWKAFLGARGRRFFGLRFFGGFFGRLLLFLFGLRRGRRGRRFRRGHSRGRGGRRRAEGGAAGEFDLHDRGAALARARGPVAEQKAGDQAQQQHRQQPEDGAVATDPAAQIPAAVADRSRRAWPRAWPEPTTEGPGGCPGPGARRGSQAVPVTPGDRRTGSSAGRRPPRRHSWRTWSRPGLEGTAIRLKSATGPASAEGACDVFAGAGSRGAPRRPPRSPRTRRGRRGT